MSNRRSPGKDLSLEELAGVHGGISKALHDSNEKAKHAFQKIGNFLTHLPVVSQVAAVVNGIKHHESAGKIMGRIGASVVDVYTHGAASIIKDPLDQGKRGLSAFKDIAKGAAIEAASDATRGVSKVGGTIAKAVSRGVSAAQNAYSATRR